MDHHSHRRRRPLGVLAALLVLIAIIVVLVTAGDADRAPDRPAPPAATPTATATPSPTATPAGPAGDLQARPDELDGTVQDLPNPQAERLEDRVDELADRLDLPPASDPIRPGGAQLDPCRPSFQTRGFGGSRSYVPLTVLHYTVSPNVPGTSDIYGIKSYLQRVGLSASVIMDFEGNCIQTVPYSRSPYTQGAGFNSYSDSVEIIATGRETRQQWLAAPIIRDRTLARWVASRQQARGLPGRFVDPAGCSPRAGYTDHNHLECGNDHHDVSPNFPFDVFQRQVRDVLNGRRPITARDRARCKKVKAYRDRRRARLRPTADGKRRQAQRIETNRRRGLKCVDGQPRRR